MSHRYHSVVAALLLLVPVVLAVAAAADTCNEGVLTLQPPPAPAKYEGPDPCFTAPLDLSSLKAACMRALRVRVAGGVVKVAPLVQGKVKYLPGAILADDPAAFDCKDVNASGLLYPGSTTSASLMLWDNLLINNYNKPLANLTRTAGNQISLVASAGNTWKFDSLASPKRDRCTFNFTVTRGCVLGARAPAVVPEACPAGYEKKTGRFNTAYCSLCAPGTYSSKAGSSTPCKPCRPGTYSNTFGATRCKNCSGSKYSAAAGAIECQSCYNSTTWTDGKQCRACPAGSFSPSFDNKQQCLKCSAGKRCCTVGFDKNCPRCASRGPAAAAASAVFALESATPASCFASAQALCNPKIDITVDGECLVAFGNNDYDNNFSDNTCSSTTYLQQMKGPQLSLTDISQGYLPDDKDDTSLTSGLFSVSRSRLLVTIPTGPTTNLLVTIPTGPTTNCTLSYHPLSGGPIATLLGTLPQPAKLTTCPAGQYLLTATDGKTGPCLPCPPATYSPAPSRGRSCIPCPVGTYANRFGSTACAKCPAGRVARQPGTAWCSFCDSDQVAVGGQRCEKCPKGTSVAYAGAGPRCLGTASGSACCAAGDCKGQAPCKLPLLIPGDFDTYYTAILQLVGKPPPGPACSRAASFLSQLPPTGPQLILYVYAGAPEIRMLPYISAVSATPNNSTTDFDAGFGGAYTGTATAYVENSRSNTSYGLISNATQGTVTIYPTPYAASGYSVAQVPPNANPACSATFKLVNGYAFDLTPPKGVKCHPADAVNRIQGRQFCRPCSAGYFLNTKTKTCEFCPDGYYNDKEGATKCKPCKAGGFTCYSYNGKSEPAPCGGGKYSRNPLEDCEFCPANTYGSLYEVPTTKCTPCPKGTIAPPFAPGYCYVPWDKVFPK